MVWLRMAVRFYQAGEQDLGESDGSLHWAYPRNGGFTWIIYGFIWFCLQFTAIAMVKNLWNDDDQPRGHVLALASEAIWIFQHYQRVTHFYPHFEWFNVVVLMGNPLVQ